MEFVLSKELIAEQMLKIITESGGHEGVIHVAGWVKRDIGAVFGKEIRVDEVGSGDELKECICDALPIVCVSADKGSIAKRLHEEGVIDLDLIKDKRETYIFKVTEFKDPEHKDASGNAEKIPLLVIVGSDKRGTIYGMLHLSELLGVSPFTDWLDIKPKRLDDLILTDKDDLISKEPSVRYRGFFINDEWPAFGNWCNARFGGFNAECYEHVFEMLLRLKGNYMWPAMWSSIFPEDGPGLASAELADKLGVVMGMSHHEPCLRQGEEYKHLRGPESIYGDAWDFRKNKEGITRFWEDGLKRGGHLENVITVGMRGEFDSTVLGKEATLGDNIKLIRDVLKTQNELIRKYVNEDLTKVPRMLALYKEVEAFYYGDETYKGLQGEPELDGVTLMLCDDNFGNLRTVPPVSERDHNGGWGMYYHMDYHGWPISHEWVNSNYLPKIWEQMTSAYEFGIRELWIVNVGDIFTNEYPLSFFMDLAYDYEKWGATVLDAPFIYTRNFIRTNLPELIDSYSDEIYRLLLGYSRIASNRRPEAMNVDVYDPVWYGETDKLIKRCEDYMDTTESIYKNTGYYPFYELVYYPLMANLNVQKLWLYTGLNHWYAGIGAADMAKKYAEIVNDCMLFDLKLTDTLHTIHDGMWYGMGMSEHIGFNYWNEEECSFPVLHIGYRPNKPRIITCITGTDRHTEGGFWTKSTLVLDTFLRPDTFVGSIRLCSIGAEKANFEIITDTNVIKLSETSGTLDKGEYIDIDVELDRAAINADGMDCIVYDITVRSPSGDFLIRVPVNMKDYLSLQKNTYVWCGLDKEGLSSVHYEVLTDEKCLPLGYISIEASHYTESGSDGDGHFKELREYGKTLSGMKAFPVIRDYTPGRDAPYLDYGIYMEDEGEYEVYVYAAPANPVYKNDLLRYGIQVISDTKKSEIMLINTVTEDYAVGDDNDDWKQGVLDNIRISISSQNFISGLNTLRIYAVDPGFVLQKILICKKGSAPAYGYLGPSESYRVN